MAKRKSKKLSCYYAHGMYLYGTKQEGRDIHLLETLGFIVVNPNTKKHKDAAAEASSAMQYYVDLVRTCDILAFRRLPNGKIPSGVILEITGARDYHLHIIELFSESSYLADALDVKQTVAYYKELGER